VIAVLEFLRSLKPQLVPHTESNASVTKKGHNKLNGHLNSLLFFSDLHPNQQMSTNFNTNLRMKFYEQPSGGSPDGKTGVTKLIVAFPNCFTNALKTHKNGFNNEFT
jgi:hypothetical protein